MTRLKRLEGELKSHVDTIKSLEGLIECHTRSKEKIERLIAEDKRQATIAYAFDLYKSYGNHHMYIAALEACRPWVMRLKGDSMLWKYSGADGIFHVAMFANKVEADLYAAVVCAGPNWEVVQWEGEQ